jgi:hypothetical protein
MTGEAFTTQRSGTPEFFVQLLGRQLDWRNVMPNEHIEKFSPRQFK